MISLKSWMPTFINALTRRGFPVAGEECELSLIALGIDVGAEISRKEGTLS